MGEHLLLDALKANNQNRPPVWLMRQAGRFLPEYQAFRRNHSLWDLFHHPEIAAEITCLPPQLLGVDAAILFSDITVIAEVLGFEVQFIDGKGPQVIPALETSNQVENLKNRNVADILAYVEKTIRLAKQQLSVPLIGFCGGPFTVATYLIDGGHGGQALKTKKWIREDSKSFHKLLNKITAASIDYLHLQIKAGADVLQIFDSWADLLEYSELQSVCFPYLKAIIEGLKDTRIPVIIFARGITRFPREFAALRSTALSFDAGEDMKKIREILPLPFVLQGNLHPQVLLSSKEEVIKETKKMIAALRKDPAYIVNLGHGVLPSTPVENVLAFVETVKTTT